MKKKINPIMMIGIPYKDRGRSMKGADCWGLACIILRNYFNIILPPLQGDYESVEILAGVHQTYLEKRALFDDIEYDGRQAGDLIVLRVKGLPVHVGVVINETHMIHTLPGHASVFERYDAPTWAKRIEGFYRWVN